MCRFALYLGEVITVGSLITDPAHSIVQQSYRSKEREEPLNGDGFGIAWYAPDMSLRPAVFKDVSPAWSNRNLLHLARVVKTDCLLAHVRAASPGLPVTLLNCHPFAWDRLAFMHNGVIGAFQRLRRPMLSRLSDEAFHMIEGSTDSECLFGLLVNRYLSSGKRSLSADTLAELLGDTIGELESIRHEVGVEEPSLLNLVLTDGQRAVVSRYISDGSDMANSLYYHAGRRYVCDEGVCRMVEADAGGGAVIIASEPLSKDSGWSRVPINHMVVVDADLDVTLREITP